MLLLKEGKAKFQGVYSHDSHELDDEITLLDCNGQVWDNVQQATSHFKVNVEPFLPVWFSLNCVALASATSLCLFLKQASSCIKISHKELLVH
jgi:hypothetical protein